MPPNSHPLWLLPIGCTNTFSTSSLIILKASSLGSRMANISYSHSSEVHRVALWTYHWQPLIIVDKIQSLKRQRSGRIALKSAGEPTHPIWSRFRNAIKVISKANPTGAPVIFKKTRVIQTYVREQSISNSKRMCLIAYLSAFTQIL